MNRATTKLLANIKKESDPNTRLRLLLRLTTDFPQSIIANLNQVSQFITLPIWLMYITCLTQLPVESSILPNVLSIAPMLPYNFMEDITEDDED